MSAPKTLLAMSGADLTPATLSTSTLLLIDCQAEYRSGFLPLPDVDAALAQCQTLLNRARGLQRPIVHVRHVGKPGGAFDITGTGGQIMTEVAPQDGEPVVDKGLPNSFAKTRLHDVLTAQGATSLIIVGFMTHMCVSSTARVALDLGYRTTVVDQACATRDLPKPGGGILSAADLHIAALTGLSDRFSIIAPDAASITD
ncbi:MAG: cysteine hydrolase [Rhodospirillales bacterium]|uniref:cysteine hydrolase family protein n=1 Tax=Hwanghaeella sp. 1Z406 TaxID=3402811 RepID=UPI000C8B3A33|nr:cysteine hydrolase [Rhodospirillales bacterium]